MAYPISYKSFEGNGYPGDLPFLVQSGSAASIGANIPVVVTLGAPYVTAAADGTPVVGTDYMAGITTTVSTDTASADGLVQVLPLLPGIVYLMAPKSPSTYFGASYLTAPSQTTYNTQVGNRVVFDLTGGVYTIDSTDSANNGLVVAYVDVNAYPGMVGFMIRAGASMFA